MAKTKKTHDTTLFTFSHSSLSLIEQCPRKWFFRYINSYYFDIPQPWSDFGVMVHDVADRYRGEGGDYMKDVARKILAEKRLTIHPDYKPKTSIALKNLKKFYDAYLSKAKKLATEKEFRIDLTPYVDLVGLVDVLYENERGEWVVTDYKTSKKKGEHSKQLSTYFYLLRERTGKKPKTLRAQVVYLSLDEDPQELEDIVQEYVLDEDDIRACERRIQSGIDIIANCGTIKTKWRKKPDALCNYCIYKNYNLCNADTGV